MKTLTQNAAIFFTVVVLAAGCGTQVFPYDAPKAPPSSGEISEDTTKESEPAVEPEQIEPTAEEEVEPVEPAELMKPVELQPKVPEGVAELLGSWSKCQNLTSTTKSKSHYVTKTFHLDGTIDAVTQDYSERDCKGAKLESADSNFEFTFQVGEASSAPGYREIDIFLKREGASGAPMTVLSIFKIEEDRLTILGNYEYSGQGRATPDGDAHYRFVDFVRASQ